MSSKLMRQFHIVSNHSAMTSETPTTTRDMSSLNDRGFVEGVVEQSKAVELNVVMVDDLDHGVVGARNSSKDSLANSSQFECVFTDDLGYRYLKISVNLPLCDCGLLDSGHEYCLLHVAILHIACGHIACGDVG